MNKNKGFSVIELMVVIAIVGIITSLAVPAFSKMIERNRLKEAVQAFQDDMLFARTQAIKQSRNVLINRTRISAVAGDWCYGMTAAPPLPLGCDCTVADPTDVDYCELKIVSGKNFKTVSMPVEIGNNNSFNFRRGTIGADGVTFYTTHYTARVKFSNVGRVMICAPTILPAGTVALPDLKC